MHSQIDLVHAKGRWLHPPKTHLAARLQGGTSFNAARWFARLWWPRAPGVPRTPVAPARPNARPRSPNFARHRPRLCDPILCGPSSPATLVQRRCCGDPTGCGDVMCCGAMGRGDRTRRPYGPCRRGLSIQCEAYTTPVAHRRGLELPRGVPGECKHAGALHALPASPRTDWIGHVLRLSCNDSSRGARAGTAQGSSASCVLGGGACRADRNAWVP